MPRDGEVRVWAKFKYGGRSAHWFPDAEKGITACGRLVLGNSVRVITERLKHRSCRICQKYIDSNKG